MIAVSGGCGLWIVVAVMRMVIVVDTGIFQVQRQVLYLVFNGLSPGHFDAGGRLRGTDGASGTAHWSSAVGLWHGGEVFVG